MKPRLMILFLILTGFSLSAGEPGGISYRFVPGSGYSALHWMGPLPLRLKPQMALWAETPEGRFLAALFVTRKAGENDFTGAGEEGRPEALPVYFHRIRPGIDEVSGATPGKNETLTAPRGLSLPEGPVVFLAEVNRSFDYNGTYTRENSGVNGQPSLIFRGVYLPGMKRLVLRPEGKGGPAEGQIIPELSGITTALEIVTEVVLEFPDHS